MEENLIEQYAPYIIIANFAIVAIVLLVGGRILVRKHALTAGVPSGRQNTAEFIMNFFVGKARDMGGRDVVVRVAPFLATCFLFIIVSNLMMVLPIPVINRPPTSYFSVTLALAMCAVGGTLVLSGVFNGFGGAVKHLFWPNPLQLISEFTDVLSLSLRLFGNIGGEYMTLVLVMATVPIGIPLILHVLGLIPAFVQALVFTLLTASFIAGVIHKNEERGKAQAKGTEPQMAEVEAPADETVPPIVEGETAVA